MAVQGNRQNNGNMSVQNKINEHRGRHQTNGAELETTGEDDHPGQETLERRYATFCFVFRHFENMQIKKMPPPGHAVLIVENHGSRLLITLFPTPILLYGVSPHPAYNALFYVTL